MANFLSEQDKQTILALLRLKYSQRAIQKQTGINRETVSRYGKQEGILPDPGPKPATKVPPGSGAGSRSLAAPYREQIESALEAGLNAKRIYQDLREQGFPHKYWSVKRFVKKLKRQKPEVFARIEVSAGKEAQVDFGRGAPTLDPLSGRYRRPHIFRMVLSFSRHSYEEVMWRQDIPSFIRAHENAFRSFGGVPEVVVLDNLKAGILKACYYDPTVNPVYQAFARHCGFEALPCKVMTPEHKGKVEAGIKYVQNNALKGRTFESLEEQNAFLRDWNQRVASLRIHGTVKEQIIKRFNDSERARLKPLPPEPFKLFKIGRRRVHIDGHVEIEGAYYSVPCEHLGEEVTVHSDAKMVRVYDKSGKEIAVHVRQLKGRFRTLEDHLPESKRWNQLRQEDRMKERSARIGKEASAWAEKVFAERGVLAFRVLQGVISLSRKYSAEQINRACGEALLHQSFRYHSVKRLCERMPAKRGNALRQEDEIIRPLQEYSI